MLRSHAGRPTLVHFWGVTCGPCKVELPLLGKFMKDNAEVDV
jgi:Thiol-disulfide isomerase and thioredoxins